MADNKYVHMEVSSVERLSNAIIAQAIKDYTTEPDENVGCRIFFQSDWFEALSNGMDGNAILARLDKKMKEFQRLCEETEPTVWKDKEKADECIFSCPFCGSKVKVIWSGRSTWRYTRQCEGCGVHRMLPFRFDLYGKR